jgi:C-terminal processing protease CtpA/Prc
LEEEEYEDTAVLFLPSFSSAEPGAKLSFRQRATEFLEKSVAAGKRCLIIDLSENAGGHTNHGYDLLQALFPGYFMYTSSRFRDHEALRLMFKAFQNVTVDDPLHQNVSYLFSTPIVRGTRSEDTFQFMERGLRTA